MHVLFIQILIFIAYDGRFCETDRNGCLEIECFGGAPCVDVPAPGFGAVCPPCPDGFTGQSPNCIGEYDLYIIVFNNIDYTLVIESLCDGSVRKRVW